MDKFLTSVLLVVVLVGCTNEVSENGDTDTVPESPTQTYRHAHADAIEIGRGRGERIVNPDALLTATSDFCPPEFGPRIVCNDQGEPIEIR